MFHSVYAPSTRAHNTITIDGCDQAPTPATASAPVDPRTYNISSDYDYGRGTMAEYTNLVGQASHTRAVLFRKGHWWVVVDAIGTDRPRHIEATWHAHPNSTVLVASSTAASATGFPGGSIAIIPARGSPWAVSVVQGLQPPQSPYYQGE